MAACLHTQVRGRRCIDCGQEVLFDSDVVFINERQGMKRSEQIRVKQDDAAPVEKDVLAQAIVDISAALNKLKKSGLNERAILALVKDDTGISKAEVKRVLDSLAGLRKAYCS